MGYVNRVFVESFHNFPVIRKGRRWRKIVPSILNDPEKFSRDSKLCVQIQKYTDCDYQK